MLPSINYIHPDKDYQLNQKLQALTLGTNYTVIQVNGQRIYHYKSHPLENQNCTPPRGSEIFIGNLPPDCFEDELVPLFQRMGPICTLRLMLDFSGRSRGYGFLSYFCPEHAHAAVLNFNNYAIRRTSKIAVCISVDNRRLFIGNIPKNRTKEDIREVLEKYVEGITDLILYQDPSQRQLNRGFLFVEFENHRQAAIARRQLAPGNLVLCGHSIYVDWADPLPMVHPEVFKEVTKLYLSNIPLSYTPDELKLVLHSVLGDQHILKVHKINNFAFVHFTVRRFAEEARQKLQGFVIGGQNVSVEWARPIEYSKRFRCNNGKVPDNFCRSVPPSKRKLVIKLRDNKHLASSGSGSSTSSK